MSRLCLLALLSAALAAGCQNTPSNPDHPNPGAGSMAEYTVTFTGTWTAQSHPHEYPKAGLVSGPHFSGLIGASHGSDYWIFAEGGTATPGLEKLSEEGKHSPLDAEIKAAIAAGKAGSLFETDPIKDMSKSVSATVRVSEKHSWVSAVAMIAPSPDWFAGAAPVNLWENGQWVAEKTVTLWAHDAGSDDGTSYEAADKDASPKKPIAMARTPHFVKNGQPVAVGQLVFRKK